MLLFYGFAATPAMLWIPCFVLLTVITSLGAGLWLSAFNVRFRDVRYVIPFLVEIWLLATPIAYPSSLLPERWKTVYALNPMVGVVEGFRWALLRTGAAPGPMILVSSTAAVLLLVSGVFVFRRLERNIADVV
jgi:lipopolysaccharide transport system permease protein